MTKSMIASNKGICNIEGCNNNLYAKGLCNRHYQQINKHGIISGNPARSYKDRNNEYIADGDTTKILLYDIDGYVSAEALIDSCDTIFCRPIKWGVYGQSVYGSLEDGSRVILSRFLLGINDSSVLVDHKNMNTLDNRRYNLRPCDKSKNGMNRGPTKENPHGYKGIHKNKKGWSASLMANRIKYHGGTFATPEEAALQYNELAKKYHGEFARPNFQEVLR